jgi:hypothetical protein
MFCKQEIVMSDRGAGKWLPYDLNGTVHECKNKNSVQQSQQQKQTQEPEQKPLTLEMMDIRLKRVEKMLFNQGT